MEPLDERRKAMMDQLYQQYARGGPTLARLRLWLRYWRKRWLWNIVVQSTYLVKRVMDIVGAFIGLVLLSPVFLITAIAIKLEDGGPIFYKQERVGKWGQPFLMYKFRSMIVDADKIKDQLLDKNESGGVIFKMKHDPRVTRVGRIIRKLSIDELPQFWNVLKGDMSLVGPRPALPREVAEYDLEDRQRLAIKPGITCIWQVSGRSELDFQQQVALDVQYIESQSFWTDVKLLLKTIPAVLLGKGAY